MDIREIVLDGLSADCYLLTSRTGFALVDAGAASKRARLERELTGAGCKPGNLGLIILTHGDFDHSGNGFFLREKFGAMIAMHRDDSGMVERGDMFWNRKTGGFLARKIVNRLFGITRFKPDLTVDDGCSLSGYGLDATVLHLPGHSKGSIGVLTAEGDLFCGDLFMNTGAPSLSSIIDDQAEAEASVERLRGLHIRTVYPGHGRPFPMSALSRGARGNRRRRRRGGGNHEQ